LLGGQRLLRGRKAEADEHDDCAEQFADE
jgi:hypothetical protein